MSKLSEGGNRIIKIIKFLTNERKVNENLLLRKCLTHPIYSL